MKIRGTAHRGYPGAAPENTIRSFEKAVELSFSHLEFDVHLSKDGVPVIAHVFELDRMTDGTGLIKDHTVEELKELTVGGTEKIPTLEETLEQFKGKISFIIELKQRGNHHPGLEKAVLEVIEKTGTEKDSMIICIDHFSLLKVREQNKEIAIGLLIGGNTPSVLPFIEEINASAVGLNHKFLTKASAELFTEAGLEIHPGVVDKAEDMKKILEICPNALVTTNELERWKEIYTSRMQPN